MVGRSLKVGGLGLAAGAKWAGKLLGDIGLSPEEKSRRTRELLVEQAEVMATEFGKLKGSLMKAGQLVAILGEHFFPPEVTKFLRSLHNDSPPVAWPVMEKVLRRQLAPEILTELEIDPEPWAAASLGQVHRARIKSTGQELCIKIQYPGVDKAIDSDLRSLRTIFTTLNLIPIGFDLDPIFDEIRSMLRREVAYDRELEATQHFKKILQDDDRYIVPEVFPRYSSKRVLATSWQPGHSVDSPEVAALSQERRDLLGMAALDLFFREFFVLGEMQTDPHFGNYRILTGDDRDRIVLLDFGAVRKFPAEFLENYYRMVHGVWNRDQALFEMSVRRLGVLPESAPQDLRDTLWALSQLVMEPFDRPASSHWMDERGCYDWGGSDLPSRTVSVVTGPVFKTRLPTPPRELVFLDRKLAGVYVLIAHLRAKINSRSILEGYLKT